MRAADLMTREPRLRHPRRHPRRGGEADARSGRGHHAGGGQQDNRRLKGVITDRDIAVRAIAEGKDGKAKVSDCMTEHVGHGATRTTGWTRCCS